MNFLIGIVGPYPPLIGGTSTFLSFLVPALESEGIYCQVFNTQKGAPGTGITERIARLLSFFRLAWLTTFSHSELIHCHAVNWDNLLGNAIILFANRMRRKKTILTLHAGNLLGKFQSTYTHPLASILLRLPDIVTTVTPELCYCVKDLGVKHVYFIPNEMSFLHNVERDQGIIPEPLHQFISTHHPLIVLVGAMEYIHGIDVFIKALSILKPQYPDLGSIVIAYKSIDKLYFHYINSALEKLNLKNDVYFPSSLPSVLAVVNLADVFVRPTVNDGDSIAVREAMSLGIPVVASDVGFRPAGVVLFPVGDFTQLAQRISDVLSIPHRRKKIGNHTKQVTAKKYIQLYEMVLRKA